MNDKLAQDVVDAFHAFYAVHVDIRSSPSVIVLRTAIARMDAQIPQLGFIEQKPKIILEFRDKTYTINVKMNHHVKAKIVEKHRSTAKLLMEAAISRLDYHGRNTLKRNPNSPIRIVMERHGKHCDDDNLPTAGKYFRDGIADVLGAHRGVKPNSKGHYDDSLPCYQWEYTQCPKSKGSLTTYRVMVYWE